MAEKAQFNERTFESVFNSEFLRKNRSALRGAPFLPSQWEEAQRGFDIEFKLRQGLINYSLFLQHKVPYYMNERKGKLAYIFDYHSGPCYYFSMYRLDKSNQHNLLCQLRQQGEDAYYSSPLFYETSKLDHHTQNDSILENTVFVDPIFCGVIADLESHKISYKDDGSRAGFHSETLGLDGPYDFKQMVQRLTKRELDESYFKVLLAKLEGGLSEAFRAEKVMPEKYAELPTIQKCAFLLQRYYRLQWIMF